MVKAKLGPNASPFFHRDLSWLSFNERVLVEAEDPLNPLLERVRFLPIFVSNLDEFYMVRVAGLKNLIRSGIHHRDRFGYLPLDVFSKIQDRTKTLIDRLYSVYQNKILKELVKNGISIKEFSELNREQKKFTDDFFHQTLFPIITPMAVDPGHPFPVLPSKTLAFAVHLKRKEEDFLAIIPIPKNVPRLILLPAKKDELHFILVDTILRAHLNDFFKGYKIQEFTLFRVIRESELLIDEELSPDLLKSIEEEVKKRSWARVVYLEMEKQVSPLFMTTLCERIDFPREEIILINHNLDLTFLEELIDKTPKPQLHFPTFHPAQITYDNIFDRMKEGDFLVHLPFQSFQPTVDLIESAAKDEQVLAIKMTLYRTNRDSAIIQALKEAAHRKKQVTVLVEIKARFEEEINIRWVRELEEAGCHVIYGIPGLKIHSKMTLIVRKEQGQICRYIHLSTGNYNEETAQIYSDLGYFTANEDFAKDISDVFNVITGYSMPRPWQRLISSPHNLRDYFISLMDREIKYQKEFKNGWIRAKINALEDPEIIEKLYEASGAGVKGQLIVRGICCLIPGVKGLSEKIEVRSVVGRFLEHSRIFIFHNNAHPRIFLSSADWMQRNLDRRVELLFEIYREDIKEHLQKIMDWYWQDNVKSRILQPDLNYTKSMEKSEPFHVQEYLIRHYGG